MRLAIDQHIGLGPRFGKLNFDFTGGSLDPRLTFTRASTGTYQTQAGLLATAAINAPRFDYSSGGSCLLIEPAATNLLPYSQDFSQAAWDPDTLTKTSGLAGGLDGTSTVGRFAGSAGPLYPRDTAFNLVAGTTYTLSAWLRKSGTITSAKFAYFNGTTWQVGSAQTVGAAFARLSQVFAANGTPNFGPGIEVIFSGASYLEEWGWQVETGSVPTSYIPTAAASASRSADALSFTIPRGVSKLVFTFDDNSTQTVTGITAGTYTVPTNLNRPLIKRIQGCF